MRALHVVKKTQQIQLPEIMNAIMFMLQTHGLKFQYHEKNLVFAKRVEDYIQMPKNGRIDEILIYMLGTSEMTPLMVRRLYYEVAQKRMVDLFEYVEKWNFEVPQYLIVSYWSVYDGEKTGVLEIHSVSADSRKKIAMLQRQKQSDKDKADNLKKQIQFYQDQLKMIENPKQADKEFFGHQLEERTYEIVLD